MYKENRLWVTKLEIMYISKFGVIEHLKKLEARFLEIRLELLINYPFLWLS